MATDQYEINYHNSLQILIKMVKVSSLRYSSLYQPYFVTLRYGPLLTIPSAFSTCTRTLIAPFACSTSRSGFSFFIVSHYPVSALLMLNLTEDGQKAKLVFCFRIRCDPI